MVTLLEKRNMKDIVKNKELTKARIIQAFDSILTEKGYKELGINQVAKRAGVSKVLIYRYFGDFNGLLSEYLAEKAYWLRSGVNINEIIKNSSYEELIERTLQMFLGLADDLFHSKIQQEIKKMELMENNEIIDGVCKMIEEPTEERNKLIANKLDMKEKDVKGIIAIVLGGITYLILKGQCYPYYNNINTSTEEGLDEIKNAVEFIIRKCLK